MCVCETNGIILYSQPNAYIYKYKILGECGKWQYFNHAYCLENNQYYILHKSMTNAITSTAGVEGLF